MTGIAGIAAGIAANAILQTLGGTEVTLLFPAAGMPAEDASELGLADPGVEQAFVSPVIVREVPTESSGPRRRIELLVGRAALAQEVSQRNVASPEVLFQMALGVVYQGELFHIEGFTAKQFAGMAYLYRITAVE